MKRPNNYSTQLENNYFWFIKNLPKIAPILTRFFSFKKEYDVFLFVEFLANNFNLNISLGTCLLIQMKRVSFSLEYIWNNKELLPFFSFKSKFSSTSNLGWSNSFLGLNGSIFIVLVIVLLKKSTVFLMYVEVFMIFCFIVSFHLRLILYFLLFFIF